MNLRNYFKKNLSFLIVVVSLFAFRWSLADQYQVPTGSMEPTIAVGDRIVTDKMAYDLKIPFTHYVLKSMSAPARGDIIVFDNPQNGICMVKRLIGLPGDRIHIENGFVSVNGQWFEGDRQAAMDFESSVLNEFYYTENVGNHIATIKRTNSLYQPQNFEFTVPTGKYFAMGDNRDNSADSRSWGFLSRSDIKGRAWGVFYNFTLSESYVPQISRIGHQL